MRRALSWATMRRSFLSEAHSGHSHFLSSMVSTSSCTRAQIPCYHLSVLHYAHWLVVLQLLVALFTVCIGPYIWTSPCAAVTCRNILQTCTYLEKCCLLSAMQGCSTICSTLPVKRPVLTIKLEGLMQQLKGLLCCSLQHLQQ